MQIGEKLKFIRKLKGYTQEQIAKELNIERRTYANLERESTKIDMKRVSDIAKFYGIEVDELLNFNKSSAFENCFNNSANSFFNAQMVVAKTNNEEQEFFIFQIQTLLNLFNEERKSLMEERRIFMEVIMNLKNTIDKTK